MAIRRPTETPDPASGLRRDALRGLTSKPPCLPSKYHYDALGSEIFERITELPDYYPTRTERSILQRIAGDLIDELRPRALVEFGSGSASKTTSLLDAMERLGILTGYGAIEVSESALEASAWELVDRYPGLAVEGVVADFQDDVELPFGGLPRLILFFGSTIGNMQPSEAVAFLRSVASRMTPEDGLLVGFDLVKNRARLEAAYNDEEGVTEQFSLNLMRVLNRELDGNIPIDAFRHRAVYNEEKQRIEAYLVAERPVEARIEAIDLDLSFRAGDEMRAEISHKYTRDSVERLFSESGLELRRWDTDPEELFAVALGCTGRSALEPSR